MIKEKEKKIRGKEKDSAHVLVMEDETTVAKGLEMVLAEEGYQVFLAATGQEALESFHQKSVDLLVADLRLPDMDGMDVIKLVKDRWPQTQVVVITGYSSINSVVNSMRLGAFDYLSKPFTEDQIKEAVHNALEVKEAAERPAELMRYRVESEEDKLIQKREVVRVLNRTAEDRDFWTDLMENGSQALCAYQLTPEAKAAIVSADLRWLNENVGELTQKQMMFIYRRLEREAW